MGDRVFSSAIAIWETINMATERVIERPEEPTRTTVIERRGSGGAIGVIVGIAALALVAIVAFFLIQSNRNDTMHTEAVGDAAASVADSASNAAGSVANAAQNAADNAGQATGAAADNMGQAADDMGQAAGAAADRAQDQVTPQ
jgi:hypothetical protein